MLITSDEAVVQRVALHGWVPPRSIRRTGDPPAQGGGLFAGDLYCLEAKSSALLRAHWDLLISISIKGHASKIILKIAKV